MATFKIRVTQSYKVTRQLIMDVEGTDAEDAVEAVASGSIDLPSFDDARWLTGWDLQHEEFEEVPSPVEDE